MFWEVDSQNENNLHLLRRSHRGVVHQCGAVPLFSRYGHLCLPHRLRDETGCQQKVSRYAKVKNELMILCKSHPHEYVTTMFDYYAMPSDTPGISDATPDIFERIGKIESIINEDIGERNCRFHFMLHEFEGILFSEPNTFHLIANDGIVGEIQRIRNDFETPEHINNSPETAPSKRLEALIPGYAKVKNGTQLSEAMGLGVIMAQCPHFKKWIEDMVAW